MSARGPEFALHKEAEREKAEEGKTEGKKAMREEEGQTDYLRKGKIKRDHIQRGKRRDSWRFQVHLREGEGGGNANELEGRGLGKGAESGKRCRHGSEEGREIGGPGKGRGARSTKRRGPGRGRGLSWRGGAKATCACPRVASREE